ncbi:hypothetical protein PR003_g7373 [Phytophthora rubi]|uniref:Uncharacterized protein n=1 Tax=Phytophthora rubi TaxID=129364 RepID=A0A6A4FK18_9STRA|nr:hypothetical protein PR003_g7373 [Phytophthora rubi]
MVASQATIEMLLMGSSQDDTTEETCDASKTIGAKHEDSSYASSSNVKSYRQFNAGNDTTCPSFDDAERCDIERIDYEGDGGDDGEDGDDNGHLVEDDDGDDDADAEGYEDCGNEYGNDKVVDIRNVACSEFNFTPEDGATLSFEFDFPDYFSDTGSTMTTQNIVWMSRYSI